MEKTILITGAGGQLGSELRDLKDKYNQFNFVFSDINDFDMADIKATERFIRAVNPGWVINCAGYTAVDRAESEPELAEMINGHALEGIIAALSGSEGKLIHISTDFVFDGTASAPYTEDDIPLPLSAYGRSKLKGEEIALGYKGSMVIRTSWLYSVYGNNFVKTIIRLASEKETIKVVNDQVGTPTYAADMAEVIMKIIVTASAETVTFENGIYHYSNEGSCSWYDFALKIKELARLKININPVSTPGYPLPAKRPAMSVMDISKIKKRYGIMIPAWEVSLEKCLDKLKNG